MHEFVYMVCKYRGKHVPYFKLKKNIDLYNTFIKLADLRFGTSENDVICTVTLRHLSLLWRVMVHYNVQQELCPRLKGIFFSKKIQLFSLKNYLKPAIAAMHDPIR